MTVQALWDEARGTGHTPTEFDAWGAAVTTASDRAVVTGVDPTAWTDTMVPGRWYSPGATHTATVAMNANQMRGIPLYVPQEQRFDRIAMQVITAGEAGTLIGMGIYRMVDGDPTERLLDAGTADGSSTGTKEITVDVTLSAGWYVLASNPTASVSCRGITAGTGGVSIGHNFGAGPANQLWLRNVTGIPDPFGASSLHSVNVAAVYLRAAA